MRYIIALVISLSSIAANAQSVIVYKTTGERISYINSEIDSIVYTNDAPNIINGHEAVDLGLSVKWAACNVGASAPDDYGDFYAYGETTTKANYTTDNSTFGNSTLDSMRNQGVIDKNDNLTLDYDVANKTWGGSWRMPSFAEINELVTECTWEPAIQNEVKGVVVTGPNGNQIFLPAAGYRTTRTQESGTSGNYRASTVFQSADNENLKRAYILNFKLSSDREYYSCNSATAPRLYGFSVRPVTD